MSPVNINPSLPKQCPFCGEDLHLDDKFCVNCGHPIKDILKAIRKCPYCGTELRYRKNFCPNCGKRETKWTPTRNALAGKDFP